MTPHDLVDAEAGERPAVRREDRVSAWVGDSATGGACSVAGCLVPEWACSPFVALAMQANQWVVTEIEVFNAQIGGLLNACSGVVEEEQEGPIPQREAAVSG